MYLMKANGEMDCVTNNLKKMKCFANTHTHSLDVHSSRGMAVYCCIISIPLMPGRECLNGEQKNVFN